MSAWVVFCTWKIKDDLPVYQNRGWSADQGRQAEMLTIRSRMTTECRVFDPSMQGIWQLKIYEGGGVLYLHYFLSNHGGYLLEKTLPVLASLLSYDTFPPCTHSTSSTQSSPIESQTGHPSEPPSIDHPERNTLVYYPVKMMHWEELAAASFKGSTDFATVALYFQKFKKCLKIK